MSVFKNIPELTTDTELEKEGIRVEISVTLEDGSKLEGWVQVRRAGGNNLHFDRVATALRKPFKYQLDNNLMAPARVRELNRDIIADACIVDFGGFPGPDGTEPAYSQANARALCVEYSMVYEAIAVTANDASKYRQETHGGAVDQAKNVSTGS